MRGPSHADVKETSTFGLFAGQFEVSQSRRWRVAGRRSRMDSGCSSNQDSLCGGPTRMVERFELWPTTTPHPTRQFAQLATRVEAALGCLLAVVKRSGSVGEGQKR